MSVRPIFGRAGCGKTAHCLDAVRAELRASLMDGPRIILLTPEQAALQMERALLGSREFGTLGRCEVLSFKRLSRKILGDATGPLPTVLSPLGRQMMLRRIISQSRPKLRAFDGVADRAGFIAALSQSVAELIQHHVTPDELRRAAAGEGDATGDGAAAVSGDASSESLSDMAELLAAYEAMLGAGHVDAEGELELARRHLDSAAWLKGAHVWLDGFAGFTPQQMRLLVDVTRRAARVDVALLLDPSADCIRDPHVVLDELSLFARTEKTWKDMATALTTAGIAIDPPILLRPASPPRFADPQLARLEQRIFVDTPSAPDEGVATDAAVRLFEAADPRSEVAAAVRVVQQLTRRPDAPLRYRDIAFVCRDLAPYHDIIAAELTAANIPYFIDHRRRTAHHPLVEWCRAAVRLHDPARFGEASVAMLKSGLMHPSDVQADLLENHILARGIDAPNGWNETAWQHPVIRELPHVSDIDSLLAARRTFVEDIGAWWPVSSATVQTGTEWVQRLDALMQRCGVQERLRAWTESARQRGDFDEAQEHEQVWRETIELLDEFVDGLGDEQLSAVELGEVLDAGFADFTLGLVPPTLDQLLVGSIDRSRHPPIRAVFVLGLSDRQFPAHKNEEAILGDAERARLEACGAPIGPSRTTELVDERMLAYIAVTRPSERLWLSYPAADNDGKAVTPSSFIDYICGALPGLTVEKERPESLSERCEHAVTTAHFASTLATALQEGDSVTAPIAAIYDAARQAPHIREPMARIFSALANVDMPSLGLDVSAALNGGRLSVSVSRLESLAVCPFQHFMKYGLRLQPRQTHELSAIDLGTLYHEVLDQFIAGLHDTGNTLRELSPADIAQRLADVKKQLLPIHIQRLGLAAAKARAAETQMPRELLPALESQHEWPTRSETLGTEIKFGGDEAALPAFSLTTPKGRTVELHGKIDRVDVITTDTDRLCLIYDYKRSRHQRLALERVFHGLSLQLLAYLLVLREHGDKIAHGSIAPAGAFLLPLLGGFHSVDHPSEADAENFDSLKPYRPRGVVDFDWMHALDPSFTDGRHQTYSVYRKKDGTIGDPNRTDAVRRDELNALLDLVQRRLGELCDRWLDGDISVRPRVLNHRLPCGHCDYASVCRFELGRGPVEILESLSRTQVVQRAMEMP